MIPAIWLFIRVDKLRIPIPLFILLPLALVLELIAFLPLVILYIVKKDVLFTKLAFGFYLTRLMFILIFYGRKFRIRVYEGKEAVNISGKWLFKANVIHAQRGLDHAI